ncbi:hypothetical protein DPMN_068012 [Dreissena polymorpha]|uniref:PKS/mFAS DH domain-containing protein n=1 Tax=Dreissena polymorpha TaxID=45954 RepID=A0A9D4BWA0_DREPO|nr:hypothetical protein DPMN_068012 [Dreissena polymorpha]
MEGKLKVVTKETGSEFVYFHIINEINVVCKGWTLFTENVVDDTVKIDIEEIEIDLAGKNAREMSRSEIYDRLERFGFKYGRNFKLLTSSVGTDQIAILNVEATREILKQSRSLSLHPCLTDTMIQSSMSVMVEQELNTTTGRNNVSFLPVAINSLQVHKKPVKRMKIIVQRINTTLLETVEQHHFRIILANTSGEIVAEIPNYTTYRKKESASAPCELRYKMEWQSSGLHDAVIVHNKTEGKYMFFGQDVDEKTKQKIEMHGLKYIDIDSISDVQNHLQQLQSSDTNAMLVYLKTGAFLLHDIGFDVKSCLDIVIDNCLFVTEFIKYCDDNHVQLYLVTENTQLVESLSAIKFNPISAAVWGFVRSVIVETRDFNVTLIDIQPSLFEIIEKLVTVVQKQTFRTS